MTYEEFHRRLWICLEGEIQQRPRGTRATITRELAVGDGYLRDLKSGRQSFQLKKLLNILDLLAIEPADFFQRALASRPSQPRLRSDEAFLQRAEQLFRGRVQTNRSGGALVDRLEVLACNEPRRVVALSEKLLDLVDGPLVPRLLGARAIAWRRLGELRKALECFDQALDLAREEGLLGVEADLLRRKSHALGDAQRFEEALATASVAKQIFELQDDRFGQGRALLDVGQWFHALGRLEECRRCLQRALDLLPLSAISYRFAALLNLGFTWKDLGDFERSHYFATQASQLADSIEPHLEAARQYLIGETALEIGGLEEAEKVFLKLFEVYANREQAIKAACALGMAAKAQLLSGRQRQSEITLRSLASLLGKIPPGTIADLAIGDLLCTMAAGEKVTLARLESALERLSSAARLSPRRQSNLVNHQVRQNQHTQR